MRTLFPESKRLFLAFLTSFLLCNSAFAQADLSVKMRTNSPTFAPFTFVTYYVTVKNLSTTTTSTGVVCNFPLPVDGRFNCATMNKGEWQAWLPTGPWNIGTIAAGDSATLQATMFCMDAPTIVGTATVTATTADPLSTNNSATATVIKGAQAAFIACTTTTVSNDSIDLELTLSASNTEVNVNQTESFVLTVFNKSSKNATGVKVKMLLPAALQYIIHDVAGLGTYNSTTGIWDIGSLGGNSNHAMTLNGKAIAGGPIKVTAQVTAAVEPDIDSQPNNYGTVAVQDDEKDLTITGMLADLSLTASAAVGTPAQLTVGSTVSFVVRLTNAGPTRADNVKIRAFQPTGMIYQSATATVGVYDPSVGVWLLSTVPDALGNKPGFTMQPNTSQTMTITFLVNQTGVLLFDSEVRVSNMPDPNSTPSNNILTENDQAQVTVTVTTSVDLTAADLELSQTLIRNPLNAGDSIVYSIGIFNRGPAAATNIVISNLIPAGVTVAATPSVGTFAANNWSIASLPLNGTALLTFRGLAGCLTAASQHFAQVQSATQNDPDSPHGNDTNQTANEDDEASIALGTTNCNTLLADLELSTTVLKTPVLNGDSVVFQLILLNKGLQLAKSVTVKDVIPAALSITSITPSVGTFALDTWTIGNVNLNQTVTLTCRGKVTSLATATSNFAQVMTANPLDPDSTPGNDTNNTADEDDETLVTFAPTTAPNADLELTMTADKSTVSNGSTVAYTLTLINRGNSPTASVTVKDVLPTGLTFVNATATLGTFANATGIWTVGTLAVNQSVTLTINVTVASIVTTIHNFAQVQTSSLTDPDSQVGNNTTGIAVQDDEASVDIQSASATQCDLSLSLAAPPQYVNALPLYVIVPFTLKIKNTGLAAANGVTVKMPVPTGQAFNSSTATKGAYESWIGSWTIGTLAAGDSAILTLNLFTLQATTSIFAQVQTNTTTDVDSSPGNNTTSVPSEDDEALVAIPSANPVKFIDLQLTQVCNKALATDGNTLIYTIKIENVGDTVATNVAIKRLTPAGLTNQTSSAQQGTYSAATGFWSVGSIPVGASRILTITDLVGIMPSQVVSFAQVSAADQTDKDSQPNNNTTTTPVEDDEASVTVIKQGTGSTCDLELSITAPPQYAIYTTHTFTLTLRNVGGVAASGIKVDFAIPTGFVNGGTAVGTAGTSYDAWLHTWDVPALAAGATATLTVPCFPLVSTPVKAFTQVVACTTLDVDSQPNNNATTTPVEDDEAAVSITTGTGTVPLARKNMEQFVPIVVQKLYPSVTEGDLAIQFNSIVEREVRFEFYDSFGQLRRSELRLVQKGEQTFQFDVWDLPQGMYIIQVSSNRLRNVPMKFVKL
jgi:large repetitive protein